MLVLLGYIPVSAIGETECVNLLSAPNVSSHCLLLAKLETVIRMRWHWHRAFASRITMMCIALLIFSVLNFTSRTCIDHSFYFADIYRTYNILRGILLFIPPPMIEHSLSLINMNINSRNAHRSISN